jgi:hypothetical protein
MPAAASRRPSGSLSQGWFPLSLANTTAGPRPISAAGAEAPATAVQPSAPAHGSSTAGDGATEGAGAGPALQPAASSTTETTAHGRMSPLCPRARLLSSAVDIDERPPARRLTPRLSPRVVMVAAAALVVLAGALVAVLLAVRHDPADGDAGVAALLPSLPPGATACPGDTRPGTPAEADRCWFTHDPGSTTRVEVTRFEHAADATAAVAAVKGGRPVPSVPGGLLVSGNGSQMATGARGRYVFIVQLNDSPLAAQRGEPADPGDAARLALQVYGRLPA